jgi:type II restriction enzyme
MKLKTFEIPLLTIKPPERGLPKLEDIILPPNHKKSERLKRHPRKPQIQATLVALNDKGIEYKGQKLGEMESVIGSLKNEKMISAYDNAIRAALMIDCVWFRNSAFMPAVIEIEHSTGVTSGLSRMKNLQDAIPSIMTRYVIVAADEDRSKVLQECNKTQFRSLNAKFFPYSAVEELYTLCQRRKLKGVTDEFLDCFMEQTLSLNP